MTVAVAPKAFRLQQRSSGEYHEERSFLRGARVKTKHPRCWPLHPDARFHEPRILYGVVVVPCMCRAHPERDLRGCRHDWVCIRWTIGSTPYGRSGLQHGRSWEWTKDLELCPRAGGR